MSKFIEKSLIAGAILFILIMSVRAFAGDLPDMNMTPGYINSDVTQENIGNTVCVSGWTKTIRPPASYTNKLKAKQMASGSYKSSDPLNAFEEDHLVSLEIGGNPTDERNLWPQHWSAPYGAHQKDQLENYLKRAICKGSVTLKQAQFEISTNWITAYKKYIGK